MKLLSLLVSAFVLSVPAFADHAVDNAAETARLAYRAADTAEALANAARRNIGWSGPIDREIESTITPMDHRDDYLRELGKHANALHLSLSDLYRAARNASFGGGSTPNDHRGDRVRESFEVSRAYFYELRTVYFNLSRYQLSPQLHSLYRQVEEAYTRLEWTCTGRLNQ